MPLLSLINLIISLHPTITSSNTDSQEANRSKLKKKKEQSCMSWISCGVT